MTNSSKTTLNDRSFVLPVNTIFSKNQKFYWPGDFGEAYHFIEKINLFVDFTSTYDISDFFEEDYPEMEDWNIEIVTNSALYFYLEETIEVTKLGGSPLLSYADWSLFFRGVLNFERSKKILIFLRHLGILKISSADLIKEGALHLLTSISFFNVWFSKNEDKIGLENLLFFLGFEKNQINQLVESCYKNKNLNLIILALQTQPIKINELFVLEGNLKDFKDLEIPKEFLKEVMVDLFEKERDQLEEFDVFNVFESFEGSKTRISEITLLRFYDELFLQTKEKNQVDLELFLLFEHFVFSETNKNLIDLDLNELQSVLLTFCLVKQTFLIKMFERKGFFLDNAEKQKDLKNKAIFFLLSLVLFFGLSGLCLFGLKPSKGSLNNPYFNPKMFWPQEALILNPNTPQAVLRQPPPPYASLTTAWFRPQLRVVNRTEATQKSVSITKNAEKVQTKLQEKHNFCSIKTNVSESGQINIYNTCIPYDQRNNVKRDFRRICDEKNLPYTLNGEFDHNTYASAVDKGGFSSQKTWAVYRQKELHSLITKEEKVLWGE